MSWLNVIAFTFSFLIIGLFTVAGAIALAEDKFMGTAIGLLLMAAQAITIVNLITDGRQNERL